MNLKIKVLPYAKNLPFSVVPSYQTPGASGMDLVAAIERHVRIPSGHFEIIPVGIAVEVPAGFEAQVRGRSGLAFKHGISLVHGIGTVDADFRGEMNVPLLNHSGVEYVVAPGDRIAQMVICPVQRVATIQVVDELSTSVRGEGGYGSTGR